MSSIRRRAAEGIAVGDRFEISRSFSAEEVARFGQLSHDENPVHTHEGFAHARGMPGTICHGLLVASLLTEIGGQIGWLASGMELRFRRPVSIGETVRCVFTVTRVEQGGKAEASCAFENSAGELVLEATLRGLLPGPEERAILRELLAAEDSARS